MLRHFTKRAKFQVGGRSSSSMAAVATSLVVGEISDGTAVLTSEALEVFRMPLALLPQPT